MRARKVRTHAVSEILVTFDCARSLLRQHGYSIVARQLTKLLRSSGAPNCHWCMGEVLYAVDELLLWAKSLVFTPHPHSRPRPVSPTLMAWLASRQRVNTGGLSAS